MAEVLLQFDPSLRDVEGRTWVARVCGRLAEDSLWEGWIEFEPQGGGTTLRTPPETKQPNRADLEYWATGLTISYLEGALSRALDPATPDLRPRSVAASPAYDRPAPAGPDGSNSEPTRLPANAVLDPFEVYVQGEDVLRQELNALDEDHLRNIIRAHGLAPAGEIDRPDHSRSTLAEMIVDAARNRLS